MSPELAAYKFARWLKLRPQAFQLRIRNEWQGEELRHALVVAIDAHHDVELPSVFEGYQVRHVSWGK